jgi:hypothetical protein
MRARKETGRSALMTPKTALTKVRNPKDIGNAANDQRAADICASTAMRALRRFVKLRSHDAMAKPCLKQLALATDAVSSATWAVEYEAGLRIWGEQ